jgi:LysR family positive regulator for ilvC
MDIHSIRVFNHLAHSLHFGRTSRACNLSPSALTRTIQRMEEELGVRLLQRDTRRVALTPTGLIFSRYAEEAEQRWLDLRRELTDERELRGEVSLFCSVTAAQSLLPRILGSFRQRHPGVQLKLQTGDAAEAIGKLRAREAEVSIAALPETLPPALVFLKLAETPLEFIGPADTSETIVFGDNGIDWQATPFILAERGPARVRLDRWFRDQGIEANIYAQVAGNEALLTMVSLGFGVGVVPRLVLEQSPLRRRVRILEVGPRLKPFIIGACTSRQDLRNPLVQALWASIGEGNGQLSEEQTDDPVSGRQNAGNGA